MIDLLLKEQSCLNDRGSCIECQKGREDNLFLIFIKRLNDQQNINFRAGLLPWYTWN